VECCVVTHFAGGLGFAGAALVEEDDAVDGWVEVVGVAFFGAASWAAVEEYYCFCKLVMGWSGGEIYLACRPFCRIVSSVVCG
jgi:hypothetical protein